ncbi:MAG: MBL fold metallo-hydrolase [Tannerella sp.]|jgi:glyoxylase-like metal-dependent hydrolase (beta-lactamase superfamily II)|nr:MBL fold metallo-hydrolase [Tannerella sp.]
MKRFIVLPLLFLFLSLTNIEAQEQREPEQTDVITFAVGSYEITTLSEEQKNGNTSVLIDASPEILSKHAPEGTYPTANNAFLVKALDKVVLIDAGYGMKLFNNLQSRNITAEKVDVILITHMHGDHIGGLLKDGAPTFPNAEIYIAQPEYDYWMSDKARGGGVQARAVIEAYKDKLHLFTPSEIETEGIELFSGFRAVATYGHTPGHTAFLIESNGSKMLVWGDLTHAMALQIPHPEIAVTYDTDPQQAIASRKKLFEYVALHKIPVAGMHIAFPAVGNVKKGKERKYSFEALCLCLGI